MPIRTCLALGATALLVVVAPSAQAAKPAAFRISDTKVSKRSVLPGGKVRVTGKVTNGKGRRTARPRLGITLRRTATAKGGRRLLSGRLRRIRGGLHRRFRASFTVPRSTRAGRRYLVACVRPGRRGRPSCAKRRITVRRAPVVSPGPTPAPPPAAPGDTRSAAQKLREAVNVAGMKSHLAELQQIADENGGNRASGFQGYGASVQYVRSTLSAAGYSPVTQVFDFVLFSENSDPVFERTAPPPTRTYQPPTENDTPPAEFQTMSYSASGDVEGPLEAVDVVLAPPRANTSGCEDTDFAGFTAGNVALMQRGTCTFYTKVLNAQEAGASAAVVFNQGNEPGREGVVAGTLGEEAQDGDPADPDVTIPAIGTSFAIGQELADTTSPPAGPRRVHVATDVSNTERTSTNVWADTPGGDPDNTIIIGSHLDSVDEGPGINDNGSGSAFNLETAIQTARQGIQPANRVRFAFWGAEESGLVGATRYMDATTQEEFDEIAMNLNFDMMASPNFARFVYDGDFSDSPAPASAPTVNPGAAKIEQDFVEYFDSQGLATEPTAFDGRSDYKPFQDNGIPAGGLFTGAEGTKTAEQAVKFGERPARRSTPTTTSPATRSTTSTTPASSRWPMPPPT